MSTSTLPFSKLAFPIKSHVRTPISRIARLSESTATLSKWAWPSLPMPLKFLATTYLINRTPTKTLSYETSIDKLLGAKPDYSSRRVFGCAYWPNLRPYNSHKLQLRSTRCIFLGYSNMHKGFKCLDISKGRIYISRDVIFDESIFPFASMHPNAGARYHSDVLLNQSENDAVTNLTNAPTRTLLPVLDSSVQVLATAGSSLQQIRVSHLAPAATGLSDNIVLPAGAVLRDNVGLHSPVIHDPVPVPAFPAARPITHAPCDVVLALGLSPDVAVAGTYPTSHPVHADDSFAAPIEPLPTAIVPESSSMQAPGSSTFTTPSTVAPTTPQTRL
jgi:hypothetical protein